MIDIFHPFAEIDRLNAELDKTRDGARVAMTQCSNAQAEITKLRDDHAHSMSNLNEVILSLYNKINAVNDDAGCLRRELDKTRDELEHAREGERVAMTQCSNAQALITELRAELARARTELKLAFIGLQLERKELSRAIAGQPCGHALGLVAHNVDCDYCQACADSGAIEAQLRNELTEERESRREEVRDLDELIKRFRANIARKDAALAMIEEHLPLHDFDEYGYHSPGCDTCAIQSELIKAA